MRYLVITSDGKGFLTNEWDDATNLSWFDNGKSQIVDFVRKAFMPNDGTYTWMPLTDKELETVA